jgi:hypothetical protein
MASLVLRKSAALEKLKWRRILACERPAGNRYCGHSPAGLLELARENFPRKEGQKQTCHD